MDMVHGVGPGGKGNETNEILPKTKGPSGHVLGGGHTIGNDQQWDFTSPEDF